MREIKNITPAMFRSQEGKALARVVKQLITQSNIQKDQIRDLKTHLRKTGHFKRQ